MVRLPNSCLWIVTGNNLQFTGELARRTLVTAGAISQRVTRAERDGLVVRAGFPEPGSRAVTVSLTDAGHALVEQSVDAVLGREAELVSGLDPEQRRLLTGLLDHLLNDLQSRMGGRS